MNSRRSVQEALLELEKEKALLQHSSAESQRRADTEADRKRCLETEGERVHLYEPENRHTFKPNLHTCTHLNTCMSLNLYTTIHLRISKPVNLYIFF